MEQDGEDPSKYSYGVRMIHKRGIYIGVKDEIMKQERVKEKVVLPTNANVHSSYDMV